MSATAPMRTDKEGRKYITLRDATGLRTQEHNRLCAELSLHTVEDLLACTANEIDNVGGIGGSSLNTIRQTLASYNLKLKNDDWDEDKDSRYYL